MNEGDRVTIRNGRHYGRTGRVINFAERGLVRVLLDPAEEIVTVRRQSLRVENDDKL